MHKVLSFGFVLFSAAALMIAGCSAPAETGSTPASDPDGDTTVAASNTHCPIMGGKVTADGGSAEWQGKTIGFCCPECIEKWEALSDEAKGAKLAEASKAKSGDPHEGHDHGDKGHQDAPKNPS